jgi:hypothetical protein
LFNALDDEFGGFQIDLAATSANHLCGLWFGEGGEAPDALVVPWMSGPGFLNPPYSSALIKAFLAKALAETAHWCTTVALVPDTPDTQWYQYLHGAQEIRHIPHRVRYLKADGVTAAGAMFPSCVAIFRPQPGVRQPAGPRHVTWSYRSER